MPLSPLQRDETASSNPGSLRQATLDLRFRRIPYGSFPCRQSAARELPVSACSFTQSCRGCLQSKPAGEVIDNACLSYATATESEKPIATGTAAICTTVSTAMLVALVHKPAHTDVHNHAQRQEGKQHRRSAVTH
jgi:hypothetical protein